MRLADAIIRAIDFFYVRPLAHLVSRRMFRYAVCGGANMALDLVWYFLIYHFIVGERYLDLGVVVVSPHVAALAVVFPITFFTGFWLNRNVAFCVTGTRASRQVARYALTVAGSLLLNYVCIKLFVEACGVWPTPAKALTTAVCVTYSYLAGRYFTFAERKD